MYSKVIVPLDGSDLAEKALPYADLLAGALDIPIELFEAFDVLSQAAHTEGSPMATDMMVEQARHRSERYLAEIPGRLELTASPVTTATLAGPPEQAIVDHIAADPDALAVMSTHGRSGIARWALGSVTDRVLHGVPNPVLVIRAAGGDAAPAAIQSVLAPVDGSELAEISLEHAANLAAAVGAGLLLARVTPSQQFYRVRLAGSGVSSALSIGRWVGERMRADADEVSEYLQSVQSRLSEAGREDLQINAQHLLHDNPAQAIIDRASVAPTLVVMASHGRGGFGRLILGSVADRVMRHSDAPVLVVRRRQ